jgi:hypothetical protein
MHKFKVTVCAVRGDPKPIHEGIFRARNALDAAFSAERVMYTMHGTIAQHWSYDVSEA